MKKVSLVTLALVCIGFYTIAQSNVEHVAKDVLKAYKMRDVNLLKKHASGVMKYAINESFFEDKDVQDNLKLVDNWDGKIKEIRYEQQNLFGKIVFMANVYYTDVPSSDQVALILLSKLPDHPWVMFADGFAIVQKAEFEELSNTMPTIGEPQAKKPNQNFAIEMANGDIFNNVTEKMLDKCFGDLDDDNFFIILNNGQEYVQAAYSDKGYTVEYQDANGHFAATDLLPKETTVDLFKKYYNGEDNWQQDISWNKD